MNDSSPKLIRVEEAAKLLGISRSHIYQKLLGISRSHIYQWIARGDLRVVRIGRSVRISEQTLERWIKDREEISSIL